MPVLVQVHAKYASRVQSARLDRIARKALRAELASASLTVYITSDAEMRKLNRQFHGTNTSTDVLSFPMHENRDETASRPYLGDVVISYDRARVQAHAARWRIADELDLLAVHGILHLLGYDDLTPRKRATMWKRQEEILGRTINE